MRRRDINLLFSLTQANKKKNSSTMTALVVIGALVIVALIVFLFVTAKLNVAKNNDIIADLDKKLQTEADVAAKEQEYQQLLATYKGQLNTVISIIYPGIDALNTSKMSEDFLSALNKFNELSADQPVKINSITITNSTVANQISLTCSTKNYTDAWAYVDFLSGKQTQYVSDEINAEAPKNSEYFYGVMASYSGVPAEGEEPDAYDVEVTLSFTVNWGAFL